MEWFRSGKRCPENERKGVSLLDLPRQTGSVSTAVVAVVAESVEFSAQCHIYPSIYLPCRSDAKRTDTSPHRCGHRTNGHTPDAGPEVQASYFLFELERQTARCVSEIENLPSDVDYCDGRPTSFDSPPVRPSRRPVIRRYVMWRRVYSTVTSGAGWLVGARACERSANLPLKTDFRGTLQ